MTHQDVFQDAALLRTSHDVAIRAAEWGTHRLGGATALAADVVTIAANCMVIALVLFRWIRQQKWDRNRIEKALERPVEDGKKDKEAMIEISITGATEAGIERAKAEKCTTYVFDVLVVEDFNAMLSGDAEYDVSVTDNP